MDGEILNYIFGINCSYICGSFVCVSPTAFVGF